MNFRLQAGTLKTVLLLGVTVFLLAVFQCSFLSGLTFISAIPNVVMGAVAAVAFFENERTATVFSIAAGFMLDILGGAGLPLSPIIMLLASVLFTLVSKKMLKAFFPYLLLMIAAALASAASTLINLIFAGRVPEFSYLFSKILIPEIILTVIFSIPLYPLFKLLSRLCESKGKFKM